MINYDRLIGKKDTYPDPEKYLELLKASVANEINNEINNAIR